ncbi:MAG: hypothetical protein LBJ46_02695 [Planctomycetota bacterium]|jgi:tyrosine-protein kinase Etk/Wzc|nr:hypothetical protein [Planctomycetota bacterium]
MRTILEIICRRLPTIVWIAAVILAVTVVGTYVTTPQYVSEARITVPIGQESTIPATAMTPPLNVYINRTEQIQTQIEVIQSRNLIEKTLDELPDSLFEVQTVQPQGLWQTIRHTVRETLGKITLQVRTWLEMIGLLPFMGDHERLVLACADRLAAKRQRETDLIVIGFRHPSPQVARVFLEKFLEIYVREKSVSPETTATVPFFEEQEEELERNLVTARADLSDFRAKWGILDPDAQRETLMREYSRLTSEINENRAELVQNTTALRAFETEAGIKSPETVMPYTLRNDPGLTESLKNLASLRARDSRLGTEMGPNHPDRPNVSNEIARLQRHIAEEAKNILTSRVAVLEALLAEIEGQRDSVYEQVMTLDVKSREMKSLETTVAVLEAARAQYMEKRETSRVSAAMDDRQINAIRVIEPPNLAYRPASPNKIRNILLGFVLGVVAGLAYVFFRNQFSTTIYTPEDLQDCFTAREEGYEDVRPPAVAVVFLPDLNRPKAHGLLRRLLPIPQLNFYSSVDRVVEKMPENVMTMMGRKFFYPNNERRFPKTLMLTGTGRRVGNSVGAHLLAEHLAKMYSFNVLLVETDFKRTKPRNGEIKDGGDFASWLRGAAIAWERGERGADVLPAGQLDEKAQTAFFALDRERLAELNMGYDVVVLDAGPVAGNGMALHLASVVEEVILVARSEVTRREVVINVRDTLARYGVAPLGAILDFRRFYIPNWLYRLIE